MSNANIVLCLTIYATYFALFAKFFYDAYIARKKRSARVKIE